MINYEEVYLIDTVSPLCIDYDLCLHRWQRRTSKLARSESRGKYDLSLKLQCSAIQLLEESVLCLLINSEFEHANRILATQVYCLPRMKHRRISSDERVSVVS